MISLALFGQMLFGALCGLEYIAILAGESKDAARSIGQSVVFASPIICAMFIAGTSSVLAFARGPIDFIAPIPQTLRHALGNSGLANLFAMTAILLVQFRLIAAASFIFTGVTRLPMAAGWDHLIPAWFTRLHPRYRTPINSVAFTCVLVLLLLILANIGVHAQEAFQVLSNAAITHYELSYLAMFAIPLIGAKAPARPFTPLATLDLRRRPLRNALQLHHLRLSLRRRRQPARLRRQDSRHHAVQQHHRLHLLPHPQPSCSY